MNPMETLKAIYETFGTPYPRASLIAVMLLGGILFGAAWLVLARQVGKGTVAVAPAISQQATDSTCSNVHAGKDVDVNCSPSTENQRCAQTIF
jgi:hypothetical protein